MKNREWSDEGHWLRKPWLPMVVWGVSIGLIMLVALPATLTAMAQSSLCGDLIESKGGVVRQLELVQRLEKTDPQRVLQLQQLRSRSYVIGDDEMIRTRWLEIIRRHDAKIRQLEIKEPLQRVWSGVTDSLSSDQIGMTRQSQSPFTLHQQTVLLKIEATLSAIETVVEELFEPDPMAELVKLNLAPMSNQDLVQLKMEVRLYGLTVSEPAMNVARRTMESQAKVR